MDHALLTAAHPTSTALAALTPAQVAQVRLRYEAFFGQVRGLDGDWAWEDTNAGYVLLDSLTLSEEVGGLARFLFSDFMAFIATRKAREQFCELIVDEFSSLAEDADMAARVEKARGFNAGLVLAPQVVEGMGGAAETARILGSVDTVIAHRVNTPDQIVALAGTRQIPKLSTRIAEDGVTRDRSFHTEHELKIDPNKVRGLDAGMAYLVNHGRAMKIQVLQAPDLRGPLPEPAATHALSPKRPAGKNVAGTVPFAGTSSEQALDLPF